MRQEFSTPLVELPTFLSAISMVTDDRAAIVQKLIQAGANHLQYMNQAASCSQKSWKGNWVATKGSFKHDAW
jgi:hypothetical protein